MGWANLEGADFTNYIPFLFYCCIWPASATNTYPDLLLSDKNFAKL